MSIAIKEDDDGIMKSEFTLPTIEGIEFVNYVNEEQLDDVMRLVGQDLSEPYSSKLGIILLFLGVLYGYFIMNSVLTFSSCHFICTLCAANND